MGLAGKSVEAVRKSRAMASSVDAPRKVDTSFRLAVLLSPWLVPPTERSPVSASRSSGEDGRRRSGMTRAATFVCAAMVSSCLAGHKESLDFMTSRNPVRGTTLPLPPWLFSACTALAVNDGGEEGVGEQFAIDIKCG